MVYDLLKSRRSMRRFQSRIIENEKVDIVLKSALLAPSSRGIKPWEFIVVDDPELLKALSRCRDHGSQFLAGAPLGIVVAANPEMTDVWVEDTSIAAIIIQLAAESLGLGSCWIQVRNRMHASGKKTEDYINEAMKIPQRFVVECIIAIGYPAEVKQPHDDNALPIAKIHHNEYGKERH